MRARKSTFIFDPTEFLNIFRSFAIEDDEPEEDDQEEIEQAESIEEETPVDDGQIKPFMCKLCSTSFSKFEGYREHFASTEHRYKRRDEKKRLGVGFYFSPHSIILCSGNL